MPSYVFVNCVFVCIVSRCRGFRIATELLDALRRLAALPASDEPQAVESTACKQIQLLVGNLVEIVHLAFMGFGDLVEPHISALGHHHRARHPVLVRTEPLVFLLSAAKMRDRVCARIAKAWPSAEVLLVRSMKAHPHR